MIGPYILYMCNNARYTFIGRSFSMRGKRPEKNRDEKGTKLISGKNV